MKLVKKCIRIAVSTIVVSLSMICFNAYASEVGQHSDQYLKSNLLTLIDSTGREVQVRLPLSRIAFNHFSTAEAINILNGWDKVVARGRNLDKSLFTRLDEIPVISAQGVYDINYEKLFELEADLFLAIDLPIAGAEEMIARLEPHIPVVTLNFRDPKYFADNLRKLGLLLGKHKEAEDYLSWFDGLTEKIKSITQDIPDDKKPNVFFKTSWGDAADIQTFTNLSPGISERNQMTASLNVAHNLPSQSGWVQTVDPEWLLVQDVDILVIMDVIPDGYGLMVKDDSLVRRHKKAVIDLPVFSRLRAVKNDRVYMMSGEFFATPRFIIGFSYMAKWFHPQLLKNFDPEVFHQEYLKRFMRIDIKESTKGMFSYP